MDIEAALERVQNHKLCEKGVLGIIVLDANRKVIRSSLERDLSTKYASIIPDLAELARHVVRDIDPQNDLEFFRIRSNQYEIMVAPKKDFDLIVIQDPSVRGE